MLAQLILNNAANIVLVNMLLDVANKFGVTKFQQEMTSGGGELGGT